jgi:hypothetical protein
MTNSDTALSLSPLDLISFMLILLDKTPLGAHFPILWEGFEKEFCFQCPLKGGKGGDDAT